MIIFKKTTLFLMFFGVLCVKAQDNPKNIVKLNVLSAIGSTASVEYERSITSKFSLNGSFALMPNASLPFKSVFSKVTNDSRVIQETNLGAFSMALEGRYYVNNKKTMEGVYVAPFAKFTRYNVDTQVDYNSSSGKDFIPVAGHFNAFSGGAALGVQWIFSNRMTVDWRIIGLSYGSSKGSLRGEKKLSAKDQKDIRDQLNDLSDKLPIVKLKNEVNADGVKSTIDGPWFGVRTGLSIGYSF